MRVLSTAYILSTVKYESSGLEGPLVSKYGVWF